MFGIAAEMGLAEPETVQQHLVAFAETGMLRRLDDARQIDAQDQGKAARNCGLARQREAVLVVDGGMRDANRDVAVHQFAVLHFNEADSLTGVGLVDANGFE